MGGGGIHQHDNNLPAFMSVRLSYLFITPSISSSTIVYNYPTCLLLLPHSHTLALSNPMHPMLSTMRIPGLRRPVFLVLVASAVAALSLLFFSRQYVEITSSGGGQRIHVSGLKAKECLTREFAPSSTVHEEYHHSINPSKSIVFIHELPCNVLHSAWQINVS